MKLIVPCWLVIVLVIFVGQARLLAQDNVVSISSMLREMTDRDRLALWPSVEYRCAGFSSYDRESVSPDKPGWFANKDYNQFIRKEENAGRTEMVLMDADGPGAIVRFWNAASFEGTLRFYFDNSPTPTIEAPLDQIIGGANIAGKPFSVILPATPLFGESQYLARNLFFPIPYAKHCKVTWESKQNMMYYNINYLTFAAGTKVQTFTYDALKSSADDIATAAKLLQSHAFTENKKDVHKASIDLAAGEEKVLYASADKSGALRRIRMSLRATDLQQALRSTIIQIRFDDHKTVWCPAGAFFGTGYDIYPHTTWFTRIHEQGWMESLWAMPFSKSVEVKLINLGTQPVHCNAELNHSDWTWTDRSMYFHAAWHELNHNTGPQVDANFITIEGKGVYVGDSLQVFNNYPDWWGEGDEKIYLDGESFPSTFGTGTEDYYGYSWCRPNFFELPWAALPYGRGNKRGGVSVNNRYRLLDAIPFNKSMKLDMEIWLPFAKQGQSVNFAPATFFYAMPGAKVTPKSDPDSAKRTAPISVREYEMQK